VFRQMAALGVTPNMISVLGLVFAFATGACLLAGAGHVLPVEDTTPPLPQSWWPLGAGFFFLLSALADILDGQLARRSGLATKFGAVFDSTLDRFGDMAIYIACALYFAAHGNLTFVLISCLAMVATTQISYVKARAENLTTGLGVGFWQRAERMVAMILGGAFGRVPAALCILALFPMFTVLRRVLLAQRLLGAARESSMEATFERVLPWRQPRYSPPYLILCAAIASAIVWLPWVDPFFFGAADPLRNWLGAP